MLQVVDDVTVNAKTDKPAIALKVLENNDAVYQNTWNDAADYNITNSVPYRIVSIVPDMTYFDTYYYQITDTISSVLLRHGQRKGLLRFRQRRYVMRWKHPPQPERAERSSPAAIP
jgi:hypothetical protein